ncbi:hypothetical protein Tco_0622535 [Tanacetum coccineum]
MGQPTVWVAQPHGWESDEAPTARLEGCTGRLEAFCPGFYFPFAMQGSCLNPLIENYERRNKEGIIEYHLQQVKNANLKLRELSSAERLEVDDKLFNHEAFWQRIGKPTSTNPRTSLIKELLIKIMHKLLVGSLVHRVGSKERCQKSDMLMMSALEESRGISLDWVIAKHLCKHALSRNENSLIYGGHYVTKIAHSLGYLNEEEVAKCS